MGSALCSASTQLSVTALERMGWRPFSGVGQATFSLLGVKPEGKKQEEERKRTAERDMVNTISFIQANL